MSRLSFTMDAKDLRGLTSQALRTVSTRGVVAVLAGVQLTTTKTKLVAVTTDLDVGQRITVKVADATPGSVLIPARQFDTIVATFEGDVLVQDDGDRVAIRQDTTTVSVEKLVLEDYPRLPEVDRKTSAAVVMADDFSGPYKFVRTAASQDESRPVLTGILFEPRDGRLGMAATDSYRLAFSWAEAACRPDTWLDVSQAILRAAGVDELARLLNGDALKFTEIRRVDERWFCATVETVDVYLRLIDGTFPNVPQLIPETWEEEFEIERKPFVKALTRVTKLGRANSPTRLIFFEKGRDGKTVTDELVVHHVEQDSHELTDRVPMTTSRPAPKGGRQEIRFGINSVFAKEAAAAFSTDSITLCMINELRPVLFRTGRDSEGFLVMPVRLSY